jgi:SnoaL-like protein
MMKKILVASLLAVALASPAVAQPSDKQAVQDTVERFLLQLGGKEYDKVAATLAPKALVMIARQRDGQWTNSFQTGEEWVAALKKNPNPAAFREPLSNVTITIDSGRIAYLRADFQIMRDGKAQSHGVDQFTLVRDGDAWKMAVVAFTSIPQP